MRAIMIVGLLAVMLIVGILTMQQMGARSNNGQTEIQAREYIDRAEEASEALEEKMQGLEKQLNHTE
jgi:hypothetical protein